jgi:hypothetical protein
MGLRDSHQRVLVSVPLREREDLRAEPVPLRLRVLFHHMVLRQYGQEAMDRGRIVADHFGKSGHADAVPAARKDSEDPEGPIDDLHESGLRVTRELAHITPGGMRFHPIEHINSWKPEKCVRVHALMPVIIRRVAVDEDVVVVEGGWRSARRHDDDMVSTADDL